MNRVVLQVVGEARAGKSEVCAHLVDEFDFVRVIVSNLIRTYANSRGLPLGRRSDYLEAHRRMKGELGNGIIADSILKTPSDRICVDGIRVPSDVERLRAVGSEVIALHCPVEIRFARAQQMQKPIDPLTLEEFIEDDEGDAYSPDPEQQNTRRVMAEANYHIDSSQPLATVLGEVDAIVIPLLG